MPLTHTRTFRVRYYECDAYGHLNNANYVRFMQETAFDASAAAGYDLARYEAMNRRWLIHETEVEFLEPLFYDQHVEIKTWVEDFRRARSRRVYEFRRSGSGELVARGANDWVFLNAETGKPAGIPEEMCTTFLPEGSDRRSRSSPRFPEPPPAPPGVFKTHRQVAWHDLDMVKHVNNAVYLEYIEACGMQVIAAHHWPVERMTGAGFAIMLRKIHIQYRLPALLGDELELATWASEVRRATAIRHYTITRCSDGELLAQAHALGVWVNLETGQPVRIPPEFLADFAPNLV